MSGEQRTRAIQRVGLVVVAASGFSRSHSPCSQHQGRLLPANSCLRCHTAGQAQQKFQQSQRQEHLSGKVRFPGGPAERGRWLDAWHEEAWNAPPGAMPDRRPHAAVNPCSPGGRGTFVIPLHLGKEEARQHVLQSMGSGRQGAPLLQGELFLQRHGARENQGSGH